MFCPNGSLIDLWIENRFLECFVETILVSILAILMTIFGTAQYLVYKYHGRPRRQSRSPQYRLCSIQIIITCLIPLMSVFKCLVCIFQRGMIFDHQIIYMLVMVFVFSLSIKLILLERKSVVLPYFPASGHGKILLVFWILVFSIQNVTLLLSIIEENWLLQLHNLIDQIELAIFICNYILTLLLLILGLKAPGISEVSYNPGYRISCDGNLNNNDKQMTAWINIKNIFKTIVFFLWPMKNTMLFRAITCVVLLISDRVVNVLILLYCTQLVASLTAVPLLVRWDLISIYLILKFLQGSHQKGILNVTTRFLWIQIEQYTTQRTQVSFIHLMHQFSLSWHMANDDNKVLHIVSCGIESANDLLSTLIFNVVPASIDIIVAGIFFIFRFNLLTGIAIWISMILYITLSIYLTQWRVKYENQMNAGKNMCKKDYFLKSMARLETIKYCVTEDFEIQSYKKAIMIDHYREIISKVNIFMLDVILSTAVCTGLLGTFYVYVNYVDINQLTMENCILIIIYITQMYEPLNYFSNIYKPIQMNYNNMHKLYSLMITIPDVSNMPDAKNIDVHNGQIEFRNVSFTYPMGTLYLYDISFVIRPGKTLAVVGPPGSGKTTILKLLLRFYNINCGYIKIDDQNIQSVTVNSLRNSMGVLPQNIVVLNNTIKFNINYGRIGANNLQVISSAVATKLHHRIKQFSNLYDTEIGLKGLELNTEELQRMAIARLLLKEPDILVLDDISKGLDAKTAREIETALYEKCAKCTKIIVARRLSSIAHADEIIVMKYGYIQERGRHEELIANNDMYARMWFEQRKSKSKLFEQW